MITKSLSSPLTQRLTGKEGRRFARFLVVGALGFVVDFGVFHLEHALGFGAWLAAHFLPVLLSQPAVIEQTISQGVAIISNFIWNYFWIYPEARAAKQTSKMAKFVLVSVLGLVIGIPIFSVALLVWQWLLALVPPSGAWADYAATLALMTRVGILLFWNFLVNRFWTYREVK
jgi:putative flippase GtrA